MTERLEGVSVTGLDDVPVDAQDRMERLIDRYAVTLRSVAGAGVAVVGLLTRPPSAASLTVLLTLLTYSLLRLRTRRHESPGWLLGLDAALALALALAAPFVSTAGEISTQSGLVNALLGAANCTLVWQLRRWWPVAWVAALVLAHGTGASWVPGISAPFSVVGIFFLPIQALVLWLLAFSVRRSARRADGQAAELAKAMRDGQVAASRRVAEREHWAILHDTAAATLLMVGSGVPPTAATRVRRQAARDLRALSRPLPKAVAVDDAPAPLAPALRAVVNEFPLRVTVSNRDDVHVPEPLVHTLCAATRELLTNIERHAGIGWATITVTMDAAGRLLVDVIDDGCGFAAPPSGSRGLRESVIGRVERAGGRVAIDSAPGAGTRVRLTWPAP